MPLHLLRDIPREIREQIYAEVLSSPSRCVTLGPCERHDTAVPLSAWRRWRRVPPLNLFVGRPLEIGDEIYAHLIPYPDGCVSLGPNKRHDDWAFDNGRLSIIPFNPRTYDQMTSEPTIRLDFLRTCNQIYLEARSLLWRHNTLALAQPLTLYAHSRFWDPALCYQVRSVCLRLEMTTPENATTSGALRGTLKLFGNWAEAGSLRFLTLTMLMGPHQGMSALDHLVDFWGHFGPPPRPPYFTNREPRVSNLERLKEAGKTLPARLNRRIMFEPDWDVLPLVAKIEWMKRREHQHPQAIIKEIHDIFGGEFWMDGKLCFKNHVEVERVFDLPPNDKTSHLPLGQSL